MCVYLLLERVSSARASRAVLGQYPAGLPWLLWPQCGARPRGGAVGAGSTVPCPLRQGSWGGVAECAAPGGEWCGSVH